MPVEEDPYKDSDDELDDSSEEDDDESNPEAEALVAAVNDGASKLQELSATLLTDALTSRIDEASTTVEVNAQEVIGDGVPPGSRLELLQDRLGRALQGKLPLASAQCEFLETVFGFDFSAVAPLKRNATAKTLLTHLAYGIDGDMLGVTQSSNAKDTVQNIASKFNSMSDKAYWKALASAYDGERCGTDDDDGRSNLTKHLVFMGLSIEMSPQAKYRWPHSNGVSFQVDQLIAAASRGEGEPVDMGVMYRRAAKLSADGKPIPRAITAELVRMAIAELSFGVHPSMGATDIPTREVIERALTPELGQSDLAADALAQKRNQVRDAARKLLPDKGDASSTSATGGEMMLPRNIRAARGFLSDLIVYQTDRLSATLSDPKKAATFKSLLETFEIAKVIDAWSKAYRAGTSDPDTLLPLLQDVASRANSFGSAIDINFSTASTDDATACGAKQILQQVTREIAYEASELLRPNALTSCSQVGAAETFVESLTEQERARRRACICRDSNQGLGDYVNTAARTYTKASWFVELKDAADAWTLADTRNLDNLSSATATFADKLDDIEGYIGGLPTTRSTEVAIARQTIDAVTSAVLDRWSQLQAVDSTAVLSDALKQQLASRLTESTPVPDVVEHWSKGKGTIGGKLSLKSVGLAKKLVAWQNALSGLNPSAANIAATTYSAVEGIIDYRQQIQNGTNTPADKTILLGLLDDILSTMSSRLTAIKA